MLVVFPRAIIPAGRFSFRGAMVLVTIDEMVVNQNPVSLPTTLSENQVEVGGVHQHRRKERKWRARL
jgi:hypothetical protein